MQAEGGAGFDQAPASNELGGSNLPLAKLEQLLSTGAYLQVRREAERLLLEGGLSVGEQGVALRMACKACLALQEYYAAAKLGERAIERAKEAGDRDTMARAHFYVGCAYTYIGDTHAAEQTLHAFLALAQGISELESWEGIAYYNLSILHRQRKQWGTAIQTLERAARIFDAKGQKAERAQASLDLAWCCLMLGATPLARPHLDQIAAYLQEQDEPDEGLAVDLICAKALLYRLEGDIATSSHLCQTVFLPGRQGVTSHHLGEAAWIMGENALDLGHLHEASLFVNMALDHAARDNWPSLMNLAGELRQRIAARTAAGA